MLYETIPLAPQFPALGESAAALDVYARQGATLADQSPRWGVLILPGGGYEVVAPGEGEPVALDFLARGMQAFVLRYSVSPAVWPQQFLEVAAAIAYLRANREKYNLGRIAVCGFSAGGHLAGCLANLWENPMLTDALGGARADYRPDAAILAYPVISEEYRDRCSSFRVLTGGGEIPPYLSLEKSVTAGNPPTFLWATCADQTVPLENTLLYAYALRWAKVPFALHIFPDGPHAMGTATAESARDGEHMNREAADWLPLCAKWLEALR